MKNINNALLLAFIALLLGGCSLVKLTPEGRNVAVMTAGEVRNCTLRGDTTVSVLDKVVMERSSRKVSEELEILARNAAADRGGDTIVATTGVENGERSYNIYQCRR